MDHAGWGESDTQAMRMRSISSGIPHSRESAAKQQGMSALPVGNPQPAAKQRQVCSPGRRVDICVYLRCGSLGGGLGGKAAACAYLRFVKPDGQNIGRGYKNPLTGSPAAQTRRERGGHARGAGG